MARDKDIEQIVHAWQTTRPREVAAALVWKVVLHYFPASEIRKTSGSHHHLVIWPESRALAKVRGSNYFEPFNQYGEFLIPISGGKRVKGFYLQDLVRAIAVKENYDEINRKKS